MRRLGAAYMSERDDVLKDVLHVAASLGVGEILDPDVGIHRFGRQPACDRRRAGIVGGEAYIEAAAITVEQVVEVCRAERPRHGRIEQCILAARGPWPPPGGGLGGA